MQLLQAALPAGVVDVQRDREDLLRQGRGLDIDLMGVPVGIHAKRLVEHRALVVAHIHCGENGGQEELDPADIARRLVSLGSVFISKAKASPWRKLIAAPFLEPFENRVKAELGVRLQGGGKS